MELEDPTIEFQPSPDPRPRMHEPLPVKLLAVEDVHLHRAAGIEVELDRFYIDILGLERDSAANGGLVYRSGNFALHFEIVERLTFHESMRAQGIEIPSLSDTQRKLVAAEIEFTYHKGITPGRETLLLLDPAGNWIELIELRIVA